MPLPACAGRDEPMVFSFSAALCSTSHYTMNGLCIIQDCVLESKKEYHHGDEPREPSLDLPSVLSSVLFAACFGD